MSGTALPTQEEVDVPKCSWCDGQGWYVDYCSECYRLGEHCGCSGEQRQCERCGGTGG